MNFQLDPKSTEVDSHEEFLEGFKFSCPCMVSRLMTVVKIYGFMGRECLSAIDGVDVRSLSPFSSVKNLILLRRKNG